MNFNDDEIDWSSMHNRIIPKEKLISLEQFYNLTISNKNNNKDEILHEAEQNLPGILIHFFF